MMTPDLLESSSIVRRLLDPSELGTREYWDSAYTRELQNYEDDASDEGTIWFDENGAEAAILKQLDQLATQGHLCKTNTATASASRFLDLGTGNGHLLFALREEDDNDEVWQGELVGVDYSDTSVQLARRIAAQKEVSGVRFEQWDLLQETAPPAWLKDGFDVVLDKGTFDAISLMSRDEGQEHACDIYRNRVAALVKPGYFLSITSCNWTKRELLEWLAPEGGELEFFAEAKYPTFTFGGQTGQTIVTLVLRRKLK
ncbi:hypothetical protein LTR62_005399 [Meristemomyces frigidus]|uniref:Protein-lysine N-methyltransferase EFM4 n=1 Tax=Meristemomyces frigidus TaxID=1508187 RepID=A0AAN7TL14_9PEZI|nr:hypothetical protein LTR62_005399 [Meristemomyces frigidus]